MPDLRETIRRLSPEALTLFKRQIRSLSEVDRQRAFSNLYGIPELADILGDRPSTLTKEKEKTLWQKAVSVGTAPLRLAGRATQQFGAFVTDPFTPPVPGTENLPMFKRQMAEYEAWQEPEFTMPWGGRFRPTKGIVETLPWLAVPTAGATIGKLGSIAARGGSLGRAAQISASALKPVAALEALPGKVIGRVGQKIVKAPLVQAATSEQQAAVYNLIDLVKAAKPLRKEQAGFITELRGRQIAAQSKVEKGLLAQGVYPEEAFIGSLKSLAGEAEQAPLSASFLQAKKGITEDTMKTLWGMMELVPDAWDKLNTKLAFQKLMLEKIPTRSEMARLEKVFGSELIKELLRNRTFGEKFWEGFLNVINAPRALLASLDLSGLLRQGGVLTVAHPLEAAQTVKPMIKAAFSTKYEEVMDALIRSKPNFKLAEAHGLYIAPTTTQYAHLLSHQEEAFMTNLFRRLPEPLQKLNFVGASNRAYVTGLNDIRTRIWEQTLDLWKRKGVQVLDTDLDDLAKFINYATGRGDLGKLLEAKADWLNAALFSPRLIASRLELPTTLFTSTPLVRKEVWKTLLTDAGVATSLLTATHFSGQGRVEINPLSADFAKLKIGDTRFDFWTGYAQYLRFTAQFALAKRKTQGGRFAEQKRMDSLFRLWQSKSSPFMGFITDLLKGETYMGEDLPPKSTRSLAGLAWERLIPLTIQDTKDALEQSGLLTGIPTLVWASLGVGVTTYVDEVKQAQDKAAKKEYGLTWEQVGQKYGRAEQLRLAQTTPEIIESEKEHEKRFGVDTTTRMGQFQAEGKSIEEQYRKEIEASVAEFERPPYDGVAFRERIRQAKAAKRFAYTVRNQRPEFKQIMDYYKQPLSSEIQAQSNPNDVARREYYKMVYSDDLYDPVTKKYNFDLAEQREQEFISKYGQAARDYIETYEGNRWIDKPEELKLLEQAQDMLKPFFDIADKVWAMYPPQLKQANQDLIAIRNQFGEEAEKRELRKFPQILRAREMIARQRKMMKQQNPQIAEVYRVFYGR